MPPGPTEAMAAHLAETSRHVAGGAQALLILVAKFHSAGLQDRDGGAALLQNMHKRHPGNLNTLADAGYQGLVMASAVRASIRAPSGR